MATFPTRVVIVPINGSTYEGRSVLKSTAVSLGEIAISSLIPDDQQLEEVKRQTAEFIAALPRDKDTHKVLVDGGEDSYQHITLDEEVDKKTGATRPTE